MVKRSRGRPRIQRLKRDHGTPELQEKRLQRKQFLGPMVSKSDLTAYLGGSSLHAIFLMRWIDEGTFQSSLAFARLMHQAYRSMGLRLHVKSHLVRKYGTMLKIDEGIEQQWRDLLNTLKRHCTPGEIQFLQNVVTATPSLWPSKIKTVNTLKKLHQVMQESYQLHRLR